tara:strand:+ start:5252 stop:5446 length:195 start_codon:yes stop_codon:yes gene_type:complete
MSSFDDSYLFNVLKVCLNKIKTIMFNILSKNFNKIKIRVSAVYILDTFALRHYYILNEHQFVFL